MCSQAYFGLALAPRGDDDDDDGRSGAAAAAGRGDAGDDGAAAASVLPGTPGHGRRAPGAARRGCEVQARWAGGGGGGWAARDVDAAGIASVE